jgi:hypothetical protein
MEKIDHRVMPGASLIARREIDQHLAIGGIAVPVAFQAAAVNDQLEQLAMALDAGAPSGGGAGNDSCRGQEQN